MCNFYAFLSTPRCFAHWNVLLTAPRFLSAFVHFYGIWYALCTRFSVFSHVFLTAPLNLHEL